MQHFYDAQIRRYLVQIVRLFGQFSYQDGKGNKVQVPVTYGDLTRQVGSIIRDNSENKIPSAPRMAVYITGLEMDTTRLADSSYINKLNIRERALNAAGDEYLNKAGKNYTVERIMPTPYTLSVSVDIWSTNTDQKLQIMEQILMLFNPSLEIQTTDNYVDWTSLSVLEIDNINFSNRTIPTGTDSEIDIGTIGLKTPIFISPPAKVKKLGVITEIITAIFNDNGLEVNIQDDAYAQSLIQQKLVDSNEGTETQQGPRASLTTEDALVATSYQNYDIVVLGNKATLYKNGVATTDTWTGFIAAQPFKFEPGLTELRLQRNNDLDIIITIDKINPDNESELLLLDADSETLPSNTIISGPGGDKTYVEYIIDPQRFDPKSIQDSSTYVRLLLLGNIGNVNNTDGAAAWKNNDNTDFVASENDIIEWDGNRWNIVFDASETSSEAFVLNANTDTQYKWTGEIWILSYEGEYPNGTWRLAY
jgi:hypothetical protein